MDFLLRKYPLAFFVLFSLCIHSFAVRSFFDLTPDDENEAIYPTEQGGDYDNEPGLKSYRLGQHYGKETTTPPPYCPPCPTCRPYYPPPTTTPPYYPPYQTTSYGQPPPPPPHYEPPPQQQGARPLYGPPPPRQPYRGNHPRGAEGEPAGVNNITVNSTTFEL